jgi:hypothetical protein
MPSASSALKGGLDKKVLIEAVACERQFMADLELSAAPIAWQLGS